MNFLRAVSVIVGAAIVLCVLVSSLQTVVLPRQGFTRIARVVFALWHRVLVHDTSNRRRTEDRRALFAPVSLVSLPLVWMVSVIIGFALIFWGVGVHNLADATSTSGSSVTTLGFVKPSGTGRVWLAFVEAIIGLGLVALLISYLPTIYAAYNQREKGVGMLLPLAGQPPTSERLLQRLHESNALSSTTVWSTVSQWMIDLEQNHTSFPALCWFPAQRPGQSWVAATGAVLDAAALLISAGDREHVEGPTLILSYGSPGLSRIGRACGLPLPAADAAVPAEELTGTPVEISVQREEYDQLMAQLARAGVVGPVDLDRGWPRFASIRAGYDLALRGLAGLTAAAPAPLTTDRPAHVGRPHLVGRRPLEVDWHPVPR